MSSEVTPEVRRMSNRVKIKRCEGLLGTGELDNYDETFIDSMATKAEERKDGNGCYLTPNQEALLNKIFAKHFSA